MNSKMLTLSEAAEHLGVHPKTLQRLDRTGELRAARTITSRRVYSIAALDKFQKKRTMTRADELASKIIKVVRRHYRD